MHAKMPKFLGLGILVKFAKRHRMHPRTLTVPPKHLICRTCWTICVLHKSATTLHMPHLLAPPSIFLTNMVTYPPPNHTSPTSPL